MKFIRFMNNLLDKIVILACLIFFLLGAYGLYDSYMIYQHTTDDSILKYKPGYASEQEESREIQGYMAAWLTVDDTGIDYPVMQGKDNTEFLNKDPFGEYSLAGSIFLDWRNSPDFSDQYSLIYGHHMEQGMMFGALDSYMDHEFFDSHREGTLTVDGTAHSIHLFAVLECTATEEAIFAPTETDNTLEYVTEHALYLDDSALPGENERILALSTCKYPDTAERTVVFGTIGELP